MQNLYVKQFRRFHQATWSGEAVYSLNKERKKTRTQNRHDGAALLSACLLVCLCPCLFASGAEMAEVLKHGDGEPPAGKLHGCQHGASRRCLVEQKPSCPAGKP